MIASLTAVHEALRAQAWHAMLQAATSVWQLQHSRRVQQGWSANGGQGFAIEGTAASSSINTATVLAISPVSSADVFALQVLHLALL